VSHVVEGSRTGCVMKHYISRDESFILLLMILRWNYKRNSFLREEIIAKL
jgi:hypothetical protein